MVLIGRERCLRANKVRIEFILRDLDYSISKWSQNYFRLKQLEQLDRLANLTIKLIKLDKMLLRDEQATHARHNARRR